jgi:hypothetical protein
MHPLSGEMKNQTRLNHEGKIKSQQRIETINFRREIQTAVLGGTCSYNLYNFGCAFVFRDNSAYYGRAAITHCPFSFVLNFQRLILRSVDSLSARSFSPAKHTRPTLF